jgi:hypothetical protein
VSNDAHKQPFIFVTGASRSGTTMLSRVLGNADAVLPLNELHFFGGLVPVEECSTPMARERASRLIAMTLARIARDIWVKEPTDQEWMSARRIVAELADEEVTGDELFARAMAEILRDSPANRVCEQTPRNIYYAKHLLKVYPNAKVVHVVRDPRAVLASQKDRYKIRKLGGKNVPVSEVIKLWLNYHPFSMMKLWRSATQEAQSLQDDDRFQLVRYEDLIGDPQATLQTLCAELDLEFKDEMMNVPHWGSSTVAHTASAGLSSASIDKWQSVLNGAEIAYCEACSRPERESFGYADSNSSKAKVFGYLGMTLRLPIHVLGAVLANPGRVLTILRAIFGRKA